MSRVLPVPVMDEPSEAGSAWTMLRREGARRILTDAARRLRAADGFSHARSLAFVVSLLAIQGIVALVGLASALGNRGVGDLTRRLVQNTAPGSAGRQLLEVVDQARATGRSDSYLALGAGIVGSLVTATTGMGQVERCCNRLYGIEQDRPTAQKYLRATILAVTAGSVVALAFVSILYAGAIGDSFGDHPLTPVWGVARGPLGLLLLSGAVTAMHRWCPNRRQPNLRWLWLGAAVSVLLWTLATVALTFALRLAPTFGDAYGPLAGIVALMLWSALSSIAYFYGAAVAAQLEAVHTGTEVVADSRPGAATPSVRPTAPGRPLPVRHVRGHVALHRLAAGRGRPG